MQTLRFLDDTGQPRTGTAYDGESARLLDGQDPATGERVAVRRLLPPVEPTNIFCIGLNYRAHAEETGAAIPEHPVIFMKPTSTVIAPGEAIRLPASQMGGASGGGECDAEAELAVVIGGEAIGPCRDVSVEDALQYVRGYTLGNDVSARRWQKEGGGGQWVRGKSFDTFCPLGPVLVTPDEVGDPQNLTISLHINGERTQHSTTGDMIFSVAEVIAFLSRDTTLLPGTVILTGTPPGVGVARTPPRFLQPGDEVVVSVEGIGELRNRVEAAG